MPYPHKSSHWTLIQPGDSQNRSGGSEVAGNGPAAHSIIPTHCYTNNELQALLSPMVPKLVGKTSLINILSQIYIVVMTNHLLERPVPKRDVVGGGDSFP